MNDALLHWYDSQAAALPWRTDQDPYKVWLSEIMLQQTQVTAVIPYFHTFLRHFPTLADLAHAELDAVLKCWEGLGYYSRARNLHKAAQVILTQYGGQFPHSAAALEKLPGIGRYTAGAIASIAFGEVVPVLDGNVMRVFSRLFNIEGDITQSSVKNQLWALAADHMPSQRPGDYNQALMELGRTICKPRRPVCHECPVAQFCAARRLGVQEQRPVKKRKAPTPHYDVTAGLIRHPADGKLLIAQRPADALLGGLWEFPGGKQEPAESLQACLARELAEELAIQVQVGAFFVRVKHAFTHFKITLHVFECDYLPAGGEPQALGCAAWRWVREDELQNFAFGAADRQVIAALVARREMLL